MATPVVQLAAVATAFLAGARLVLTGVARSVVLTAFLTGAGRSESLITFVPARTAVRVIAFRVRSIERLQSVLLVRRAIGPLSGLLSQWGNTFRLHGSIRHLCTNGDGGSPMKLSLAHFPEKADQEYRSVHKQGDQNDDGNGRHQKK